MPSLLTPVSYPLSSGASAVAVGDFTGTGIADLVTANDQSSTVSVLLGKGDGTFQPAQNYAVGGTPVAVAVGDLNGDGKLDIITANSDTATVSVLLGNGDGTFKPALNYSLPGQSTGPQIPASVAVGDLNKDGKLDVAVGAWTYSPGTPGTPPPPVYYGYYPGTPGTPGTCNGYVNVLIGNGEGGFSTDSSYALPASPSDAQAIAVGDFNGDGNLDLAVADHSAGTVSVLLGNGDGTLAQPTTIASNTSPWGMAVGDLNGDGKLDIVMASEDMNTVSVSLGNGDGTFAPPVTYSVGTGPSAVALADLNRDGKLDIVTVNGADHTVSVLLGKGDGTFQTAQNFASGSLFGGLTVGDFNRDGWPDVAVTNQQPDAGTVSVLLNAADWSAPQASRFAVSGFPSPTTAGASGSFTVTALYADGTTDTRFTGTVHFTSSDWEATLPSDYTFTSSDAGVHTFSAVLKTAGTQSLTASDGSITGSETGITVTHGAASKFLIGAPTSVRAGVSFSLTLTVEDAYGNVVTNYLGTVHFSCSDTRASLPANYTFKAGDQGVHTFSGLVLRKAGYQKVTVTDRQNSALIACVIIDVV